ncbi:hypothetical protein FDG92_gp09 [Arthrobacter phage Jasmine]|uniref:Acb2/Tad1 hairpin domain-containing protein n=1 Tax=Arthrobacter phage Jasmine TaxID=1772302 RepID=A0A0U4JLP2_9CAUD|nr:hypothetical protein FDG92_gp09 [Arthrobacter phage Jasmine]ALY09281.1 hypothetical protein JASMINE_9 [Arthrobacter phage Jasmine]
MTETVEHDVKHERPFEHCICGWNRRKEEEGAKRTNDIKNRFGYHKPDEAKVKEHALIRAQMENIAQYWASNLPAGREQATALTKLEEAMFWANAAIARN